MLGAHELFIVENIHHGTLPWDEKRALAQISRVPMPKCGSCGHDQVSMKLEPAVNVNKPQGQTSGIAKQMVCANCSAETPELPRQVHCHVRAAHLAVVNFALSCQS